MTQQVSDTHSHRRDQIANFADVLRNAPARQRVCEAVYFGKRKTKSAGEIANRLCISRKRVTMIAKPLCRQGLFEQGRERLDGSVQTVYRKNGFFEANKRKILNLSRSRGQLERYHTKSNPQVNLTASIKLRVPFIPRIRFIAIDEVDQFSKVRKIRKTPEALDPDRLPENIVKRGILRLLEEVKIPRDWPGETNDIFSVKLRIRGKARRAAFALKGPAKTGTLVPGMMGKNGDQIQRLFNSPADVFFVQYEGEIAESVVKLMEQLAKAKAILGSGVMFGTIDREATYRLRLAYPKAFCR